MNTRITLDRLMEWGPCEDYPRERLGKLFAGRAYVTPAGVHRWQIPLVDRMWVLHFLLWSVDRPAYEVLHRRLMRIPVSGLYSTLADPDTQAWFYAELLKIFGVTDKAASAGNAAGKTKGE